MFTSICDSSTLNISWYKDASSQVYKQSFLLASECINEIRNYECIQSLEKYRSMFPTTLTVALVLTSGVCDWVQPLWYKKTPTSLS